MIGRYNDSESIFFPRAIIWYYRDSTLVFFSSTVERVVHPDSESHSSHELELAWLASLGWRLFDALKMVATGHHARIVVEETLFILIL